MQKGIRRIVRQLAASFATGAIQSRLKRDTQSFKPSNCMAFWLKVSFTH